MLEVRGLSVSYRGLRALRGVSLDVGRGEIAALVGANGAGKSSLMRAVAGLVRPEAGSIRLDGAEIAGLPSHRIMARGLALCPEGRMILGGLTVEENLALAAPGRHDFAELYALFPRLAGRGAEGAASLSGGEAQMLAIARALAAGPRLLLMDEPSLGLSPRAAGEVFALLPRLRERGLTILLVEQNLKQALGVADRAYVLESGEITLEGPAKDVLEDDRIAERYLGPVAGRSR